ncbi:hypothetical protein, partial [Enterobacter roggenkampii]|uniref:hypothetical protein n=1 Tax=Enterobacter roggenkampii TaxID=1812935 RepID=UPI00197A7C9C
VQIDVSSLPEKTIEGNYYSHALDQTETEDNKLIYQSFCEVELMREWNRMSKLSYDGIDKINQPLRYYLMRY